MCKVPDYINTAVGRLNEFLPNPAIVEAPEKDVLGKLPLGVCASFDFYEVKIMGKRFLLGGVGTDEDCPTPGALAKQRNAVINATGVTPIFVFGRMASYNFTRYTKMNLDIIVGSHHIFLPSIFLIVGKEPSYRRRAEQKVPALFQLLVLYHLQRKKINGMTMVELARLLEVSYATVNRGIRWMRDNGFARLFGGKEKQIQMVSDGMSLWEKALPYLESPVAFVAYTQSTKAVDRALVSGQNALAEYTLLNGGPHRVAVSKNLYKEIKNDVCLEPSGDFVVEVWKYDPRILSDTTTVDRLSLFLLLKDCEDERVQIALENMLDEMIW